MNGVLVLGTAAFVAIFSLLWFITKSHSYMSTACHHGLHRDCRRTCKFCTSKCRCHCHWKEEYVEQT
jgi:hypothetical protein